ncbi:hypothetical protein FKM82_008545 [Ascaphus truei]
MACVELAAVARDIESTQLHGTGLRHLKIAPGLERTRQKVKQRGVQQFLLPHGSSARPVCPWSVITRWG